MADSGLQIAKLGGASDWFGDYFCVVRNHFVLGKGTQSIFKHKIHHIYLKNVEILEIALHINSFTHSR